MGIFPQSRILFNRSFSNIANSGFFFFLLHDNLRNKTLIFPISCRFQISDTNISTVRMIYWLFGTLFFTTYCTVSWKEVCTKLACLCFTAHLFRLLYNNSIQKGGGGEGGGKRLQNTSLIFIGCWKRVGRTTAKLTTVGRFVPWVALGPFCACAIS
jgi:hypothetical protein